MKIFDAIQQVVPCPKTKSSGCQCDRLEGITEAEETIKAIAQLEHTVDDVQGFVKFKQKPGNPTIIKGIIKGLEPGKHGFHIHEYGDLSDGCTSAGGHYNPDGVDHGNISQGHVGDLGNITADQTGTARFQIKAERVQLSDVVGRAIVIHADEDDLGKGGDEESLKTGNAGDRLGCGVIRLREVVEEDYQRKISNKHFDRNQLPQINRKDVQNSDFDYKEGKISISNLKPVQSQRVHGYDKKAEQVFLQDIDKPFIIDKNGYIINGHHRYDAANMLGIKRVKAIKIEADIEDVMNYFSHTSSDTKVMGEDYFKKLLHEKMLAFEDNNVTQVNFDLDKTIKVNPTEPQKAYDAFIGDYLPFNFSNGMELNVMDEDYDPNYTVWVLNDVNGKQIDMGEKADDLVDVLQSMTHIPIQQDVANYDESKSSPGRVKRAGASCKGSVSELRRKAKKYSGEKGKMYHWCANMKAGKKKS
mgnify:CR=1 FL=1